MPLSVDRAPRLWLVGVLGCAALLAPTRPATAAPTTIATLHGLGEVRAWNGVQAWTDVGTADQRWHVVVRRAGQISMPAAIPAGDEAEVDMPPRLEVDVGPGPDGDPMLAFLRCAEVCRVVVSDLDGGRARTVPGSAGASSPTIWGSRVAWVRGGNTVLTRSLGGGGATRLAGVPQRQCYRLGTGRRRCERPSDGSVGALELRGSRLALFDRFGLTQGGGANGTAEVRMESVRGGPQRLVARMNIGEGGQTWIGPSWAKGGLFFYKTCDGCGQSAYRYDPDSGAYAKSASGSALAGFAMEDDGRRAFQVVGNHFAPCTEPGTGTCPLRLSDPLTFTRTRSPIATLGA